MVLAGGEFFNECCLGWRSRFIVYGLWGGGGGGWGGWVASVILATTVWPQAMRLSGYVVSFMKLNVM